MGQPVRTSATLPQPFLSEQTCTCSFMSVILLRKPVMTSWKPPYVFLSTRRHIPLWKCVQATSLSWIWRANDWSLAQFQPLWRPYWMWQFPAEGKSHSHRNRTLALTPAPFQRNCLGRHLRNILLCQLKDMYFHITEAFNKAMIGGIFDTLRCPEGNILRSIPQDCEVTTLFENARLCTSGSFWLPQPLPRSCLRDDSMFQMSFAYLYLNK